MKEYIEREAMIKRISDEWSLLRDAILEDVNAVPTADVRENVHGEWVEDDYGYIHCSHCGMEWDEPEHPKTNFCPDCGARNMCHCLDYDEKKCPKRCFRYQITKDLRRRIDLTWMLATWAHLKETNECAIKKEAQG